jgi:2-oxoglutarate dehydrogenase E1 component
VSQAGGNTPANHFGGSFGPNEWLVQEMYERYQSDPSSVDKSWWEFFADYKGTPSLNNSVKSGTPPIPKSQLAKPVPAAKPEIISPEIIKPITEIKETPATSSTTTIKPADPVVKPIPTLVTPGAATVEPLRGVAARVVQSMEGSLSVPTATSVRVVPAKLMIDNRTVINNHLKRGRGGKVSFTHIIGYAMVKALRAMPEMNTF